MAMIKIEKQSKITVAHRSATVEIPEDAVVKKVGAYEVIDTPNEGIKRIVNRSGGYLVTLDYGRVMKTNKKTGLRGLKQDKTVKVVDTLAEAKKLRAEAEVIRKKRKEIGPEASLENHKAARITMKLAVEMYKSEGEFRELGESYQRHVNNYLNHILDYFKDFEPCKITKIEGLSSKVCKFFFTPLYAV